MHASLYEPFKNFDFNYHRCYLSGKKLENSEVIQVLPPWLMKLAGLNGTERLKLLDESIKTYPELRVPCDPEIEENQINLLDQKIEQAFSRGYVGVIALDEIELFHWIGKFLYGLVYIEMNGAIRQQQLQADGVNMGQGLMHKFSNLQMMIQGIFRKVEFEDFLPFSIVVVPLENKETSFSFRDEINTLTFSMKFKDFGIVACLQDNGMNARYHEKILALSKNTPLSDQQFDELSARFYYSAYLFNRLPEYTKLDVDNILYLSPMPLRGSSNKPLFDVWQHKTYAKVLEDFWKPWGYTLFEILKDPQAPMSFFVEPALPVAG